MTNDVGPFQDIIEVGWPTGEPSDTGWLVNIFRASPGLLPEFTGTLTGWTIGLLLPIKMMGEGGAIGITASRTVNWNRPRMLQINATIVNGSGYDSGGFPSSIETDIETILTDASSYQKSSGGVIGEPNTPSFFVPKGEFNITVGLVQEAVPSPRRDPESTMEVIFTWSDV